MPNVNNLMPHNLDAEAALLGCIMIDAAIQSEVLEPLKTEDFYQESHQLILEAMKAIYAGRKTVDLVTLTDRLQRDGKLERAGGLAYLTELAQMTVSASNYKEYFELLKRDSVNRALIRGARDISEKGMEGGDGREAISFAENVIYGISKKEDRRELASLSDGNIVGKVLEEFEIIQADPNAFRGVETGFRHLDRITNGLQKSDLIVLAARPGDGKTSLAMNIVENACLNKDRVAAVFSLEMPRIQIVRRLLCSAANVNMKSALSGQLKQSDWRNLMRASDKLQKSKIFIDDTPKMKMSEILSKCRRLQSAEGRLDLVMIDYIQLITAEQAGKKEISRQQEVAYVSGDLKALAKELDVPVLALSQLHRMITTKEPQLSDLRESGSIEQDADIVMFINRLDKNAKPEDFASGKVVKDATDLVIAKHRNGELGRVSLRFVGSSTKFVDVEAQNRPEEPPVYGRKKSEEELDALAEEAIPKKNILGDRRDLPPEDDGEDESEIPLD